MRSRGSKKRKTRIEKKGKTMRERRTSGRYGGRGGRGSGSSSRSASSKSTKKSKDSKIPERKTLSDYKYAIGTAKQAGDYNKITNYLILHIRKTYEQGGDIADALEALQEYDFSSVTPTLKSPNVVPNDASNPTAAEIAEIERQKDQNKLEYEIKAQMHLEHEGLYRTNKDKAYAFLFGQCTTGLQHKIEAKTDYDSKIKGNPIELLSAIKENSLSFDDKKKPDIIVLDALTNLLTTRQKDDEELTDYTKRFKAARDLFKEKNGGTMKIPKLAENDSLWSTDQDGAY